MIHSQACGATPAAALHDVLHRAPGLWRTASERTLCRLWTRPARSRVTQPWRGHCAACSTAPHWACPTRTPRSATQRTAPACSRSRRVAAPRTPYKASLSCSWRCSCSTCTSPTSPPPCTSTPPRTPAPTPCACRWRCARRRPRASQGTCRAQPPFSQTLPRTRVRVLLSLCPTARLPGADRLCLQFVSGIFLHRGGC